MGSEMSTMQQNFFQTLGEIQESVVQTILCQEGNSDLLVENLLYETTAETIYRILEMIDGYRKDELSLDLVERYSKVSLRTDMELHDKCVEFLKGL